MKGHQCSYLPPPSAELPPTADNLLKEACLIFDATSFDILSLSEAFKKFCRSASAVHMQESVPLTIDDQNHHVL